MQSFIRQCDFYGSPIQLNYRGNPTFQSLPGGLISIFVRLMMLSYTLLQFWAMHQKKEWSITQQTVVADLTELTQEWPFRDNTNISMGLQISQKRSYEQIDVREIQKYLTINGMYEIKDQGKYRPQNSDIKSWKNYETKMEENQFKLQELKLDLSDVVLQGTSDSIEYVEEAIPRLQIRLNYTQVLMEAFKAC